MNEQTPPKPPKPTKLGCSWYIAYCLLPIVFRLVPYYCRRVHVRSLCFFSGVTALADNVRALAYHGFHSFYTAHTSGA